MGASVKKVKNKKPYNWYVDTRVNKKGETSGSRHYFKTKTAANNFLEDIIKNGDLEREQQPKTKLVLIDDIYDEYSENYVTKQKRRNKSYRNSPDTVRDRKSRYKNYLKTYLRGKSVGDIDKKFMSELSEYICDLDNEDGDQISEKLMYRLWSDFKAFIKYCIDEEYIFRVITIKDKDEIYAPISNKKPQCWTRKEFEMFMSYVDDETYECLFLVLGHAGLRKSEARGLKYKNIDFINNRIIVKTQYKNKKNGDQKLKTIQSEREVDVDERTMNCLKREKEKLLATGIDEADIGERYVFVTSKGNPIPAETIRQKYIYYRDLAGCRKFPLHHLRHYFGSLLINKGKSIPYVQDQMGHSRSDTTVLKFYADASFQEAFDKNSNQK